MILTCVGSGEVVRISDTLKFLIFRKQSKISVIHAGCYCLSKVLTNEYLESQLRINMSLLKIYI